LLIFFSAFDGYGAFVLFETMNKSVTCLTFQQSESEPFWSGKPEQLWTLGLGIAVTVFAATYVSRIAKVSNLINLSRAVVEIWFFCSFFDSVILQG
jgi:hypothetical protein